MIEITDIALVIYGETETSSAQTYPVMAADWRMSVGVLPKADVGIEYETEGGVSLGRALIKSREDIVGRRADLVWVSQNNRLLFRGRVTGIGIEKRVGQVSYSISILGGLTAFHNTTLASTGWFPFGNYDNSGLASYFQSIVEDGDWRTPKQLLTQMIDNLVNSSIYNPNLSSQAARSAANDQITQVQQDLREDLDNIVEAPIISQFFGTVGVWEDYAEAIRFRVRDLVSVQTPDVSYLEFLIRLCGEIGLKVVFWIDKTFIIPDMMFTDALNTNVFFPSVTTGMSLNSDPTEFPEQLILYPHSSGPQDISAIAQDLTFASALRYPEDGSVARNYSPFAGRKYKVVSRSEYPYLKYIYYTAMSQQQQDNGVYSSDETKASRPRNASSIKEVLQGTFLDYAKSFAAYYYTKLRYERDYGNISTVFQPYVVPGFSALCLDSPLGLNLIGYLLDATHSIGAGSATSSFTLSHSSPVEEEITIDSPLWRELIPSGAGVGDIVNQSEAITGVTHIPYTESLIDPATEETYDAEKAAVFTRRRLNA